MSDTSATTAVPARRERRVMWPGLAAGVTVVALLGVFPPFRIVRVGKEVAVSPTLTGVFEPATFARGFWGGTLQPAAQRAPDAGPLLALLRRDPAAARQAHARRVGLGHAAYYFARGTGRVIAVERSRLLVEIDGGTVALRTGPVFGNVVRDGCGLLEVNQVPGLAEFNALSAALNQLVEERVQPALKAATVGATVSFAGCGEAPETVPSDGPLLTLVPVFAEVR